MSVRRLLVFVVLAVVLIIGALAGPALAVNDPHVPGDDCAAAEQAVGHPANENEQADPAGAPFSSNNPGQSDGAQGGEQSVATDHCPNA